MIRYCLIFWSTIHLVPYWGIFPLHYSCIYRYQFELLHCLIIDIIFTLGTLRSMAHELFYPCCILYMRAWFFIIGYLGLVSFHFYYLVTLACVMSRVLRPPRGHEIRCRLRQPLLGQVFEIWLIFRYHHASSFGRRLFDVWTWFSCGFGLPGSHIWWWMIWGHLFFLDLSHIWCHTRAYSVLDEIYGSS